MRVASRCPSCRGPGAAPSGDARAVRCVRPRGPSRLLGSAAPLPLCPSAPLSDTEFQEGSSLRGGPGVWLTRVRPAGPLAHGLWRERPWLDGLSEWTLFSLRRDRVPLALPQAETGRPAALSSLASRDPCWGVTAALRWRQGVRWGLWASELEFPREGGPIRWSRSGQRPLQEPPRAAGAGRSRGPLSRVPVVCCSCGVL